MKTVVGLVLVATATWALAQPVEITSFDLNGRITWTTPSSNAVSSVEWASDLNAGWQDGWLNLQNIRSQSTTVTTNVPMYFRITCWTNGLLVPPSRPGAIATFAASNRLGETWVMQDKTLGRATMPLLSNDYVIVFEAGSRENFFSFTRSTDTRLYALVDSEKEGLFLQLAPPGTAWTNSAEPQIVYSVVSTNETVTVPAGTFTGCLKTRRHHTNEAPPFDNEWYWLKPRFGLVKQSTETGEGQFYELQAVSP